MSTLRSNALQTLDSSVTVNIADLAGIAGVPAFVTNVQNQTDNTKGAYLLGYRNKTVGKTLEQWHVTPFDFGAVGNFTTDDTVAVMAAFNYAKANRIPLYLNGDFGVTTLPFDGMAGMTVICAGTLTGRSSGSYESVLSIKNSQDVRISGRLVVSGAYNAGYACGIAIYTETAAACSLMDIDCISPVAVQTGWRIGRLTEPDATISEITISGGHSYGVPVVAEVIGTQTVINFLGCNLISDVKGAPVPATWGAAGRTAVRSIGASVTVTGGETLITDVSTGLLYDMQPIVSSVNGNQWGSLYVKGNVVETSSQFCQFRNPNAVGSIVAGSGYLQLEGCAGFHSQNVAAFIQVADTFTGRIVCGANNIFSSVTRTLPNIQCGASTCDVWAHEGSFGRGFISGLRGITGGYVHFGYRLIMDLRDFNGQSLPIGLTDLKAQTPTATGDLARFTPWYNSSTGVITIGQPLNSMHVICQYQTPGLTTGDTYIAVAGSNVGVTKNNTFVKVDYSVTNVAAGTTVKAQVNNVGSSSQSASAGATGYLQIFAAY